MTIGFRRPVGLQADFDELKYVAALLQTEDRPDGSITATDIQCLLRSRYNVNLSHSQARALICVLCGREKELANLESQEPNQNANTERNFDEGICDEENTPEKTEETSDIVDATDEFMTLSELLAILLIPNLLKEREERLEIADSDNRGDLTPYPKFLNNGLRALLSDVDNDLKDTEPFSFPLLTIDLVRDLLSRNGYKDKAEDDKLLQEMVASANSSERLDEATFLTALSSDVSFLLTEEEVLMKKMSDTAEIIASEPLDENLSQVDEFDLEEEQHNRSVAHDGETADTSLVKLKDGKTHRPPSLILSEKQVLKHTRLDSVVDVHSSTLLVVLVWTFTILSALSYGSIFQAAFSSSCGDDISFICQFRSTIQVWFIYIFMFSLAGIASVVPLSLSNDPHDTRIWPSVVVLIVVVVYTASPITSSVVSESGEGGTSPFSALLRVGTIVSGCLLGLFMVYRIAIMVRLSRKRTPDWERLVFPSHHIIQEKLEVAASNKLTRMLENAITLVERSEGGNSQGATCAQVKITPPVNKIEAGECGGTLWTWERILSGELLQTEGILIPVRVFVFQACQLFIAALAAFVAFRSVESFSREAEQQLDRIPKDGGVPAWVTDFIPTRKAIEGSLYPAATISTIAMFVTVGLYIPSITSTILKFRSGVSPSLGAPAFSSYKASVPHVYMNTGNAITGIIATGGVFYFIFGLLIFLFCWEITAQPMIVFLAWCLGVTVTILLKMVVTSFLVKTSFQGFFRQRVMRANIVTVMLEMWYISLASSLLVARVCQFLLASAFWVGRVDETFLHENVTIFGP